MSSQNKQGQPTREEGVDAITIPSHFPTAGLGVDVSLSTFWVFQTPSLLPVHSPSEEKPPLCGLLGQVLSPINGPSLEGGMEWMEEGMKPVGLCWKGLSRTPPHHPHH